MKRTLATLGLLCALLTLLYPEPGAADERDPRHTCTAPARPDKNDDVAWNHFVDLVDEFRACINRFVEAHHDASDRHRIVANTATQDWNGFVRSELNVPEDFPHKSQQR